MSTPQASDRGRRRLASPPRRARWPFRAPRSVSPRHDQVCVPASRAWLLKSFLSSPSPRPSASFWHGRSVWQISGPERTKTARPVIRAVPSPSRTSSSWCQRSVVHQATPPECSQRAGKVLQRLRSRRNGAARVRPRAASGSWRASSDLLRSGGAPPTPAGSAISGNTSFRSPARCAQCRARRGAARAVCYRRSIPQQPMLEQKLDRGASPRWKTRPASVKPAESIVEHPLGSPGDNSRESIRKSLGRSSPRSVQFPGYRSNPYRASLTMMHATSAEPRVAGGVAPIPTA